MGKLTTGEILEQLGMCAALTLVGSISALVPSHTVIRFKGAFLGLCAGAVAAIIFTDIVPEILEGVDGKLANTRESCKYVKWNE